MKEEYVFPKEWSLKINDENREIVNNWRKFIYHDSKCNYPYITEDGTGDDNVANRRPEITTSEFKQYVFNTEEPIKQPEDLSYLVDFLNNNNIK